jgi:hypothetical protein
VRYYSDNPFRDPVDTLDQIAEQIRPIKTHATIHRFDEDSGVYHMSDGTEVHCCDGCGAFPDLEVTTQYADDPEHGPNPGYHGNLCSGCKSTADTYVPHFF